MQLLEMREVENTQWLCLADPESPDNWMRSHLSETTLNGRFHRRFIDVNNAAVSRAHSLGYSIDGGYETFFSLGYRVSQQIDGRVRDYSLAKYEEAERQIKEATLLGVQQSCLDRRSDHLRCIKELCGENELIDLYIAILLSQQLPELKSDPEGQERPFSIQLGYYESGLDKILLPGIDILSDLPIEARPHFVGLARHCDIFGDFWSSKFFVEPDSYDDIFRLFGELDGGSVGNLLASFCGEMCRDMDLNGFYRSVSNYLTGGGAYSLEEDQKRMYTKLLLLAQQVNLREFRDTTPGEVAALLGLYSESEVLAIADEIFGIVQEGGDPQDTIDDYVEKRHGKK